MRASLRSLERQGDVGEEGGEPLTCFKCGETGHFRRNCPISVPQGGTGIPAVDESRPVGIGDPRPLIAAVQDSGQGRGEVRPRIPMHAYA